MKTFNTITGKLAFLADPHFGARADSPIFHHYFMKFYDDIFFPFIIKENIKTLVMAGDFTERRKFINFVTLNKVRNYFIRRIKEIGITMICTVGNHDCYYKNTNEVNSLQELFSDIPNVVIFNETEEIMIDDTKVLLVPWINDENREASLKIINETDAKYCFGHLELNGFLMNRGQKSEVGFDVEPFKKFEMVATGHYHHKSDKENIHYLGSPYEMTFADINDPRGFHIWNTNTKELDFHKNPYKLF